MGGYGLLSAEGLYPGGPKSHKDDLPVIRSMMMRPDKYNRYVGQLFEIMGPVNQAYQTMRDYKIQSDRVRRQTGPFW